MTMVKIHGIPIVLLFLSFLFTLCICVYIPKTSASKALTVAIDRAAKVRKRDLQQDEDENVARVVIPMVLSKRSATALGKLMHLLRTSMDRSGGGGFASSRENKELFSKHSLHSANSEMLQFQRRNQKSNYLRCYFNAVSCF